MTADWKTICGELRELQGQTLRATLSRLPGVEVTRIDALLDGSDGGPSPEQVRAILDTGLAAALKHPEGALLFNLYVYQLCYYRWELSADWDRLRLVLETLHDSWAAARDQVEPADHDLGDAVLHFSGWLVPAMLQDSSVSASCVASSRRHCEAVLYFLENTLRIVENVVTGPPALREFLVQSATAQLVYFTAMLDASAALEQQVADGYPAALPAMTRAVESLRAAETHPAVRGTQQPEDLRASRAVLERAIEVSDRPHLRVDVVKLVYCFPFALGGIRTDDLLERLREKGAGWRPVDLEPLDVVDKVELTDTWEGNDPLGRGYACAALRMPDVTVRTETGTTLPPHHAEVRFSTLGNHYLRVETWLRDASLHELYQATRRTTPSMGQEEVRCDGGAWGRLAEYADAVIEGVAECLGPEVRLRSDGGYHLMLSVRGLSAVEAVTEPTGGNATMRQATESDLRTAVGGTLLLRAIRGYPSALEEWVLPATPMEVSNLLGDQGFAGDVLARTANTTLVYMPSTAGYMMLEYEEMAEFTATLPALLSGWKSEVLEHVNGIERNLHELGEQLDGGEQGGDLAVVERRLMEIDRRQVNLHTVIAQVRSALALVSSPALCNAPMYRELLDRLSAAAHVDRGDADLQTQLSAAQSLYERLTSMQSSLSERHRLANADREHEAAQATARQQERLRRRIDILMVFFGVISGAGILEVINSSYEVGRTGVLIEMGTLAAVSLVTVTYIMVGWRRR